MRALRSAPDATGTVLDLPATDAQSAIREDVGSSGAVDQGTYHWRAVLHVRGTGRIHGLPLAWPHGASEVPGAPCPCTRSPGLLVAQGARRPGACQHSPTTWAQHAKTAAETVRGSPEGVAYMPPAFDEAPLESCSHA